MAKKISTTMVIVLALALATVSLAVAAGLGLFGQLAAMPWADARLSALDEAAENLDLAWTTADGVTVRIEQAYYEGNRIFIAYRLSGPLSTTALHEGAPDGGIRWTSEEKTVAAQEFFSDNSDRQQAILQLDGKGQRWMECVDIGLHDGLFLTDGTYLDIIGGESNSQPDGSLIGWKECEIPEDCLQETLSFRAVLFRTREIVFQDGDICRQSVERGEETCFDFTLTQNRDLTILTGQAQTDGYTAQAELSAGHIDLRGIVNVTCPAAWVKAWDTWDFEGQPDVIADWQLYQGGELIGDTGVEGIWAAGENQLVFELVFPRITELNDLALVPVCADQQSWPDEAIPLVIQEN